MLDPAIIGVASGATGSKTASIPELGKPTLMQSSTPGGGPGSRRHRHTRRRTSYRSVVPLDTLCDTYGLADEVIGDPAGAAESGTPA